MLVLTGIKTLLISPTLNMSVASNWTWRAAPELKVKAVYSLSFANIWAAVSFMKDLTGSVLRFCPPHVFQRNMRMSASTTRSPWMQNGEPTPQCRVRTAPWSNHRKRGTWQRAWWTRRRMSSSGPWQRRRNHWKSCRRKPRIWTRASTIWVQRYCIYVIRSWVRMGLSESSEDSTQLPTFMHNEYYTFSVTFQITP